MVEADGILEFDRIGTADLSPGHGRSHVEGVRGIEAQVRGGVARQMLASGGPGW